MPQSVHAIPDRQREQLQAISRRLASLTPDWGNPQRFYDRRDDLVDELHRMAR